MRNSKRILSLALAASMVVTMAACGNQDSETSTPASTNSVSVSEEQTETETVEAAVKYPSVEAGEVTTALGSSEGGTVGHDVYAGIEGKDYTDEAVYTFNDYTSGTTDMKWSTHTWETADDDNVLSYISSGFYSFTLNSDLSGWSITPELAAELPVDVTSEYVGSYGIEEGDTAKAWKIALNPDACWEDGTPINADSYIYSYKELLDPVMKNRRADSLYAGDFQIVNAKEYFYQGQSAFTAIGEYCGDYLAAGGSEEDLYIDVQNFWNTDDSYVDADGNVCPQYISILDETVYGESVEDPFSGAELYADYLCDEGAYADYAAEYVGVMQTYADGMSFDEVGIVKTGDYELVFITVSPTDSPDYYVPYNLSSVYLVYEDMWEACKTYTDANGNKVSKDSPDVASITTNYCTSADTTMSFGPYRMSYFELDKQITFERNENWYGYHDGKHLGQYQTDNISIQVIATHETALLAFQNGEVDNVGLESADMASYGSSDYIRYNPESYTTKLSFNTDEEKLAERGTLVLANMNFRKGFALAIDRTTFAQSYTSAGSAGYGMLNYLYVYDPFTGATYRDTDGAKDALCKLYGLTYGADGDYDTLDDAYEAITGYDLELARECMEKAYEQMKAEGTYNDETVEIEMRVYQSDDIYVQMFNFFDAALKSACEGTGFEGKVSLKMTVDADYYNTNYSGGTDMIFTTWGGATYSPYTMLYECYCDASDGSGNQMEYGFDTTQVNVHMVIDGKDFNDDLQTWSRWCDGQLDVTITSDDGTYELAPFGDYDAESRAALFAKLEYAYLSYYITTPIYYRNSAFLVSQKGDYAVKSYMDLIGYGGIQYFTYNYNDEEWDAVKGTLTY